MSAAPASRVGWLDLSCGASGDMLLGALVDAGVPLDVLTGAIDTLGLPIGLEARQVRRAGLAATKIDVVAPAERHARTWADIEKMLLAASLPDAVRDRALATFAALAEAEAAVHGIKASEVHFHEVGALDAIADVVGVCAGLDHLGLAALTVTPLALGGGSARMAHGVLPIPGPAVLEVLRAGGAPAYGGPVPVELCTPTGAALVVTAASDYGPLPAMRVTAVGSGAGTRDLPGRPNLVRLVLGDALALSTHAPRLVAAQAAHAPDAAPAARPAHSHIEPHGQHPDHPHESDDHAECAHSDQNDPAPAVPAVATTTGSAPVGSGHEVTEQLVIETNIDDLDPRVWPSVLAALLDAGALDAWLTPVLMKKGRPAHTLRALVTAEQADAVRDAVFRQTSTLGLREIPVRRYARARSFRAVTVAGQPVRVKVASDPNPSAPGAAGVAQPEWEDVLTAARTLGWPAHQVLATALTLARTGQWSRAAAGGVEPEGTR